MAPLVPSQVILAFDIPFALVPLVLLSRRRDVMRKFANRPLTTAVGITVAAMILVLTVFLPQDAPRSTGGVCRVLRWVIRFCVKQPALESVVTGERLTIVALVSESLTIRGLPGRVRATVSYTNTKSQ